jgi:pimeloyl-ACP methyl ester carboxylesterase
MPCSERIPDVDQLCSSVVSILDAYALPQVVVVAHSYGTFVASRLAQTHQQRLASLCLIDPVCFGMFIPHLLHNFIYRRPRLDVRRWVARWCCMAH